eukprot:g4747.t1
MPSLSGRDSPSPDSPLCLCDLKAELRTITQGSLRGCQFWICPRGRGGCLFQKWNPFRSPSTIDSWRRRHLASCAGITKLQHVSEKKSIVTAVMPRKKGLEKNENFDSSNTSKAMQELDVKKQNSPKNKKLKRSRSEMEASTIMTPIRVKRTPSCSRMMKSIELPEKSRIKTDVQRLSPFVNGSKTRKGSVRKKLRSEKNPSKRRRLNLDGSAKKKTKALFHVKKKPKTSFMNKIALPENSAIIKQVEDMNHAGLVTRSAKKRLKGVTHRATKLTFTSTIRKRKNS